MDMKYNPQIHKRRSIRLKGYDYSQAGLYFITICCNDRICRFGEIVGAGLAPAPTAESVAPATDSANVPHAPAQIILNEYGIIAYNEWVKLAERFHNFELDVFQIMPNHMHGIIILKDVGATLADVGAILAVAPDDLVQPNLNDLVQPNLNDLVQPNLNDLVVPNDNVAHYGAGASPAPTISDIVGAYKSLVANGCLEICKSKNETMGKLWQRNYYEHIIRNEKSYNNIFNYIINNPTQWQEDKFYNK
jgi:putative transposase